MITAQPHVDVDVDLEKSLPCQAELHQELSPCRDEAEYLVRCNLDCGHDLRYELCGDHKDLLAKYWNMKLKRGQRWYCPYCLKTYKRNPGFDVIPL